MVTAYFHHFKVEIDDYMYGTSWFEGTLCIKIGMVI
jgi:hypothetical protein